MYIRITVCDQQSETFAMNPQFQVTVTMPNSNEEGLLLIAIMQRDDRKKRRETGAEFNYISYWIFQV